MFRLEPKHLAIRLEAEVRLATLQQQQGEVESRLYEGRLQRERAAERIDREVIATGVEPRHAEVVQRERVVRVERDRTLVALKRVGGAPGLVQRHAALVPQLRAVGMLLHQLLVQARGGRAVLAQQVHLGHRLRDETTVFAVLQRELVFLERLGVVALLPEGQTEVEMGQGAAGNGRGLRLGGRRR